LRNRHGDLIGVESHPWPRAGEKGVPAEGGRGTAGRESRSRRCGSSHVRVRVG